MKAYQTNELFATEDIAAQIGLAVPSLHAWLQRYPEYRPAKKLGQAFLWTREEFDAVIEARKKTRILSR